MRAFLPLVLLLLLRAHAAPLSLWCVDADRTTCESRACAAAFRWCALCHACLPRKDEV